MNGLLAKSFPTRDVNGNTDPIVYLLQHITEIVERVCPATNQPLLPACAKDVKKWVNFEIAKMCEQCNCVIVFD